MRERVLELWKETRRTAELQALAEKLAERGNAGESFEKIAGEYGRSVLATPGIGRNSRNDTFSRTAVTKLFATPEGGFTWGPVGVGDSLLLMQVKEIREPDLAKDSSRYREIAANVRDSIQADMLQVFVTGYQREIGVEVNTGLIAQVTGADVAQ